MFGQIKSYYGCYETMKNGSLHIHTLLWLNNSPRPNKLIQTLHDNESFQKINDQLLEHHNTTLKNMSHMIQ